MTWSRNRTAVASGVIAAGALTGMVTAQVVGASTNTNVSSHAQHEHGHHGTQSQALAYTIEHLRARNEAASGIWVEQTLAETLPNQRFAVAGRAAGPLYPGVVIGTIDGVTGGSGYAVDGKDADNGTPVPFSDGASVWRVVDVTVRVEQGFGQASSESTLGVGVAIDGTADASAVMAGLRGQRALIVLGEKGLFEHNPSLYSIGRSGALLGFVADDGNLSLPILGESEQAFLGDVTSVKTLRREVARSKRPIKVEERGAELIRVQ